MVDIIKLRDFLEAENKEKPYKYTIDRTDAFLYYGFLREYQGYKISQLVVIDEGRYLLNKLLEYHIPPKLRTLIQKQLDIFESYINK